MSVINDLNISLTKRSATARGPASSEEFNDTIDELQRDLLTIQRAINKIIYPVLRGLPLGAEDTNFNLDSSLDAVVNSLDGTQIFTDRNTSETLDDGFFYDSVNLRPKTVKESLDGLRALISAISVGDTGGGGLGGFGLNDVYHNTVSPQTIIADNGALTVRAITSASAFVVRNAANSKNIFEVSDPGSITTNLGSGGSLVIKNSSNITAVSLNEDGSYVFRLGGATKEFIIKDSGGGNVLDIDESGNIGQNTLPVYYGDGSNLTGIGGGVTEISFPNCPSSVQLNDAVYISGADTADRANATSVATGPAIGFVKTKPTTTSCTVVMIGELDGFVGLSAGTQYYLDTADGAITTTAPNSPGNIVQIMGIAKNTTTMLINPGFDYVA